MSRKRRVQKESGRTKTSDSVLRRHKRSVVIVSFIVIMLAGMLGFHSIELYAKNQTYKAQEAELQAQIEEEEQRTEEIEEYQAYVQSDEYIKDIAEEKLGLVDPNEIIFQSEE